MGGGWIVKYHTIKIMLLALGISLELFSLSPIDIQQQEPLRHLILHFPSLVGCQSDAHQLDAIEKDALTEINNSLINEHYLIPYEKNNTNLSVWGYLSYRFKRLYYSLFYYKYCSEYPDKLNYAFYPRRDPHFGFYTIYIPNGVPYEKFSSTAQDIFKKKNLECYIDADIPVYLTAQEEKNERMAGNGYFSIDQLKQLNDKNVYWYQSFPTTGLILEEPYYPPTYPYLPHFFSLHQLAPSQGAGITIALIDTGACAFKVQDNPHYYKHRDIAINYPRIGLENLTISNNSKSAQVSQLVTAIQPHLKKTVPPESLEQLIAHWICDYASHKNKEGIEKFLARHGNQSICDGSGSLNNQGAILLQKIIKAAGTYTVGWLDEPYNKYAVLNFLPTSYLNDPSQLLVATHGTHTLSLISGCPAQNDHQIGGIAPQATVMMIKAFNEKGLSTKSLLIDAVKKAISGNADILNLSLKIADRIDLTHESSKTLAQLIGLTPYVVAASGNDGGNSRRPTLSYPARFETVAFDVGAFGLENHNPIIPEFSQYEINKGPLFVAPGVNIIGAGIIPSLPESSIYMYRSGTSMAAALTSGFLALLLGEFKDDFTKDELLNVCYHATFKLAPTPDWKTKTILGVLDMRTALFVLHCIKALKKKLATQPFENLMAAVFFKLLEPLETYGKKYLNSANPKDDFIAFINQAHAEPFPENFKRPASLQDGINSVVNSIRSEIVSPERKNSLHSLGLPDRAQKKLAHDALKNDSWVKQARGIKNRLIAARQFADNVV